MQAGPDGLEPFTVVIPLYNRRELIVPTIESVLAQTFPPARVVVVDDGSTDGSPEVVERFPEPVTLIRNGRQGVQAARNLGIARAETGWIALCDSDDLWQPNWLERVGRLRRAEPRLDFVFGNFRIRRGNETDDRTKFDDAPAGFWERTRRRAVPEGWIFDTCIAGETFRWHPIFPSAMAFSKELVQRAGAFDTALAGKRNEDGEFTLRLLYEACAGAIPEPEVIIRKHDQSVSSDQLRLLVDELWMLDFVKREHAQAAPYHATIDDQLIKRSIDAANLAFAARDHDLMREIIKRVPWARRPPKLHLKRAVAALPDAVALPVNTALQHLVSRI